MADAQALARRASRRRQLEGAGVVAVVESWAELLGLLGIDGAVDAPA
ncbi:hypothetical protein [Arthrobacter sp. B1805]|nr:hypothetical protein [Arthrobacter sp. B1805]